MRWAATFMLLWPLATLQAGEPDRLFRDDAPLEIRISAPFKQILDERSTKDYTPGQLSYVDPEAGELSFDIGIRTRGRLRHEICPFAPLRLNFKKSQTGGSVFHKQDKLKLVTHCRNKADRHEQAVVSEYVAYRIFNLLSDASFRVRLLRIRYDYTDSNTTLDTWGFFIEHEKRLAKRTDLKRVSVTAVDISQVDAASLSLSSLFEYYVGNTDFSPFASTPGEDCCHNYALFENADYFYVPIPFDFDQAGLVKAPYAKPNPRFGLRSAQQRLYRGRCEHNALLSGNMQRFRDQREAIYAIIDSTQGLADYRRRFMRAYTDRFFRSLDDEEAIENRLAKACI